MSSFLAGLSVLGRDCLVLGGDAEAEDKARRLHDADGRLSVVSPHAIPTFDAWMRERKIPWRQRDWRADDLVPTPFLVFSSIVDEAVSRELFARAESERFLLCCVDQPAWSNFTNVAFGRCGPLAFGVASGGAAPGLAKRVRDELVRGLGQDFADFAAHVAALRARCAPHERRRVMREALEGVTIEVVARLPDGWRSRTSGA